ncbi:hypothetical protein WA026_005943 [Henosepilachna vigintioctopunctata]|uniref:Arginase n=1 Tax=Henosepilachna vigintioctopunctata TaxID=420089 RepID=A0AAW1U3B8_9CUCU
MFGREFNSLNKEGKKVGILGVPFSKGNGKTGAEQAPTAILEHGLLKSLTNFDANPNLDVEDFGEVKFSSKKLKRPVSDIKNYAEFIGCIERVSKRVHSIIEEGRLCITIGGDHSIAAGTVDGHARAKDGNIAILWIDAHADINTPKTSHTGHPHGMPLSFVVKELRDHWSEYPEIEWRTPIVPARNIAYIGLRSVDDYERLIIDRLGITAFGMDEVDDLGIPEIMRRALKVIDPEQNRSIHLSFDIDGLDPLEAPATGTPVRGGITLREGIQIVETVYKTGRLGAFDLCEVNPQMGREEDVRKTLQAATDLIKAATGHRRSGRTAKIPT